MFLCGLILCVETVLQLEISYRASGSVIRSEPLLMSHIPSYENLAVTGDGLITSQISGEGPEDESGKKEAAR